MLIFSHNERKKVIILLAITLLIEILIHVMFLIDSVNPVEYYLVVLFFDAFYLMLKEKKLIEEYLQNESNIAKVLAQDIYSRAIIFAVNTFIFYVSFFYFLIKIFGLVDFVLSPNIEINYDPFALCFILIAITSLVITALEAGFRKQARIIFWYESSISAFCKALTFTLPFCLFNFPLLMVLMSLLAAINVLMHVLYFIKMKKTTDGQISDTYNKVYPQLTEESELLYKKILKKQKYVNLYFFLTIIALLMTFNNLIFEISQVIIVIIYPLIFKKAYNILNIPKKILYITTSSFVLISGLWVFLKAINKADNLTLLIIVTLTTVFLWLIYPYSIIKAKVYNNQFKKIFKKVN